MHRIGRTGRAGKTGIAITLVDWDELPRWKMIDKALGLGCPDPAETYSNSPHLYAELGIPDRRQRHGRRAAQDAGQAPRRRSASPRDGEKPARTRTAPRRRTRGGQPVTGHPGAADQTVTPRRGATRPTTPQRPAPPAPPSPPHADAKHRRRATRN